VDDDSDSEANANSEVRTGHLKLRSMVMCRTAYSYAFCYLFNRGFREVFACVLCEAN